MRNSLNTTTPQPLLIEYTPRCATSNIDLRPVSTAILRTLNVFVLLMCLGGSLAAAEPMDTVAKWDQREVWKSEPIFIELQETESEDFTLSPDHQFLFVGTLTQRGFSSCGCYPDIVVRRASTGDTVRVLSFLEKADKCSSYQNNIQVIDPLNRIILSTCKVIKFIDYPSYKVTATFRVDSGLYAGYIRHASHGRYFAKLGSSGFVIATDAGDTVFTIPTATTRDEFLRLNFSNDGSKVSLSYVTYDTLSNGKRERKLVIEAWDIPTKTRLMRDTDWWETLQDNKIYRITADAGKISDSGDWMMYYKYFTPPGQSSSVVIFEYDVRAAKVARFTAFSTGGITPYGYLQGGAIAYHDYGSSFKFTNAATGAQVDSLREYLPYFIDETTMRCYGQTYYNGRYLFCLQLGLLSSVPDTQEPTGIVVVPNPAQNNFSIRGLGAAESALMVMTTISGETVFDVNVPVREGVANIALMLPPGTYALRATTNLGGSFTTMVVIVR